MKDEDLYRWAHARARQLRGFYVHVGVYVVVMLFLLVINAVTRDQPGSYMFNDHMYHRGGGDWWVVWPALGWGVAVALHGVTVLLGGTGKADAWEARKAEQLIRREQERTHS
jgi:hypothetical protein